MQMNTGSTPSEQGMMTQTAARLHHPARAVGLGVAGTLLLVIAAQVRIPVPGTDVPMTLQALGVLVVALALPRGSAISALTAYFVGVAAGVPFFAPGSAGVLGPTGGYIVGFLVGGALTVGLRGRSGATWGRLVLAAGAGMAVVLLLGMTWRLAWFGGSSALAWSTGGLPFLGKALVEVLLAATLGQRLARVLGR
jgi:biotin transport system substrate-specific component